MPIFTALQSLREQRDSLYSKDLSLQVIQELFEKSIDPSNTLIVEKKCLTRLVDKVKYFLEKDRLKILLEKEVNETETLLIVEM